MHRWQMLENVSTIADLLYDYPCRARTLIVILCVPVLRSCLGLQDSSLHFKILQGPS